MQGADQATLAFLQELRKVRTGVAPDQAMAAL